MIIGAGGQGAEADRQGSGNEEKIISFGHAFSRHGGFNLLGFIDKDVERAESAKKEWDAKFASDTLTSIQYQDVVVVATPDDTHFDILKQIAKKQLSLVLCEKPICTDLEKAREIVQLYKERGIPLMVNYTRRYLPYYDHLKQYGKPHYGLCRFNRGWLHTATHGIDFFNMIGCENYDILESEETERHWYLGVKYKAHTFRETRCGDEPVWDYYDKSHWHVTENAYNFLEGKEPLKCTGDHALAALEKCFELMGENKNVNR